MRLTKKDIARINELNEMFSYVSKQGLIATSDFGGTIDYSIESLHVTYSDRFVGFKTDGGFSAPTSERITLSAFDARDDFNYYMKYYSRAAKYALKNQTR